MKTISNFILFFNILFLNPIHSFALESKQDSFLNYSFQKTQQNNSIIFDDFQNEFSFFDDNLFDGNEDDETISFRKKITLGIAICLNNNQTIVKKNYNKLPNNYFYPSHSPTHFLSLSVLRI